MSARPRISPPEIDINADVGERPKALRDGSEEALLQVVTSANVACGAHAGDPETMAATLALAARLGVAAGAHPGYPDRAGFGRASLGMSHAEIEASVYEQLCTLARVAEWARCRLGHVKPHGALYNDAARDRGLAAVIARAVARWDRSVVLVGRAGSPMLEVFRAHGFATAAEAFADRVYEPDGSLRSRSLPGSLIEDPARAAAQALRIASEGRVTASDGSDVRVRARTLCVHSDTPGAVQIAESVRRSLEGQGFRVAPVGGRSRP